MEAHTDAIREKLKNKGLKITPQRISVLEALYALQDHPAAEQIIDFVRKKNPNIATGTVYKTLDTLVKNGVVTKFRTEGEAARYDCILTHHHHLFSSDNDHIEDYENEELDRLLSDFFKAHSIPNFEIKSIKLQIKGRFSSS
ncbi:Ferric uptake regulator(Fur) [Proteiniphilum saccharofermentans]|uniref:Ferric uptake regulator(Fur) n=1 Tax=Proteiniphilum saccharofermentans TaxID=1642647 RepID=A0A1R3T8H7_9BACT|nr:transcriptional repressor [Proteiniphilum saccharofermentans]SCD21598.1 Ferric uptake regulator(Fur) [Proteiniphilum saccharofermentans]SEA27159.1 Fur family transcriptional regulator, peroxide stress response regulator [Porphyromonadaceae bacterium KH3R12]SFS52828.1 Fur family transcriptional regulator, peroxide stress response regulator [Porphyromonadaceae bacterium NLAE-zl-C104]